MKWICIFVGVASGALTAAAFIVPSAGFFGFLLKALSILALAFATLVGLAAAADRTGKAPQAFLGALIVMGFGAALLVMTPRPASSDIVSARQIDDIPVPKIVVADAPIAPPAAAKKPDIMNIGHVLGHWITPLQPSTAQFITIRQRDGIYESVLRFAQGKDLVSKLRPRRSSRGRRFDVVDDAEGTYYTVLKNGDLDIRSQDGEFLVAKHFDGDANDQKAVDRAIGALWDYTACRSDVQCMGERFRPDVIDECPDIIEREARYSVRWNNGVLEPRFLPGERWHGRDGKSKGLIDYVGDKIEFQNGFGAWSNYIYVCTFDIWKKQIVDVKLRSGRLYY